MKKFLFSFITLFACIHISGTPLLNILQVECVRKGTYAYKPKSALPFIDLSSDGTKQIDPYFSDHATAVAGYWQAGGTASLVNHWYLCESVCFEVTILKAGKTLPPLPAQWHLAILPYVQSCTWTGTDKYSSNVKLAQQAERDNCLYLVSPPDAGQGFYGSPCLSNSPNIIHVASSITGSDMAGMPPNELYFPVAWNSYAQPEEIASGIAQILDWLLQNGVQYKASDIKSILLATAQVDNLGRRMFNGTAAMAAVKAKYGSPVPPQPLPPEPVVEPTPVPTPTPVVTTTIPTTTIPATVTTAPKINSFGHWNSAWASTTTPSTIYWITGGADSVTLTDPNGKTQTEAASGQVTIITGCNGATWTLDVKNAAGEVTKTDYVHGQF